MLRIAILENEEAAKNIMFSLAQYLQEEDCCFYCNQDEYLFSYNNVKVPLKISDIYYIEKEGKLLVYHTRRGEFRERKNMKDAYEIFKPYNFLWIHVSYLVNIMYIMKIENDMVMLPSLHLPISRSKKAEVLSAFHSLIE